MINNNELTKNNHKYFNTMLLKILKNVKFHCFAIINYLIIYIINLFPNVTLNNI